MLCFAFSATQLLGQTQFGDNQESEFPDAPKVQPQSPTNAERPLVSNHTHPVPLGDCPYDQTHAPECRVHWGQLVISTTLFLTFLNAGNLYTGYWYRVETTQGDWFDRWIDSAADWHWNRWADDNPFLDDYIGHPMMGAITNDLWIQNDPKSMTLVQSNTWPYWRRMLRATAFATAVHFEWKLGPVGEAGFGHNGDHPQVVSGGVTYGTGDVELVTTPVIGGLWTMAEDSLDKHVITHLEAKSRNPFALFAYQFLNPARGAANILRFRPPWYRDTRTVKADSFWGDPPGENVTPSTAQAEEEVEAQKPDEPRPVERSSAPGLLPVWPHPGGVHEIGASWGLSLMSGHLWGDAGDVKYMPMEVRYSYLFSAHNGWTMRYSPDIAALAMLDEPVPDPTNDPTRYRKRTYGNGISPVGLQADFFPSHRVQPFLSTNEGLLYFYSKVLGPQGSKFLYSGDFGCGVNIFRKLRQDVTIGYRYQHLANANLMQQGPGTDANVFYVSVSRFRTRGYR
jgi:hypothetical protein